MYAQHLGPDSETRGSMNASLVAGAAWDESEISLTNAESNNSSGGGAVYARNLDWAQQLRDVQGHDIEQGSHLVVERTIMNDPSTDGSMRNFSHGTQNNEFYQPEPTLLDIARGAHAHISSEDNLASPTSPDTSDINFENSTLNPGDGPPEIPAPDAAFYENGR